jgi:cytochrome c oxidase subunit 1
LTGIPNALSAVDYGISDSYVIMSHFHYVMAVSGGMAIFAGVFYWFPKLTGRICSAAMTKASAVLFFVGMNIVMAPLYFAGMEGMPRRYMDYQMFADNATITGAQAWSTIGLYITIIGVLLMLVTWIHGMLKGEKATANPWGSQSLEFTSTAVIPGQGNFPTPVTVAANWHPYNYEDNPKPTFDPHPGTAAH